MLYKITCNSPVGTLTIVSSETHIKGLWIEGQKHFCSTLRETPQYGEHIAVLQDVKNWLTDYFAGKNPSTQALPLDPEGTAFQKRVWQFLSAIPYGETVTYGQAAKALSCKSARAVGCAVGRNPISILIPCHRVIGSGGSLTGYAGGLAAKSYLLQLEQGAFVSKVLQQSCHPM